MITLVGEEVAVIGKTFCYLGTAECEGCRLSNVCFNLEEGSTYRIDAVRAQKHPCAMRESQVQIVEVSKVPVPAAVPKKQALDGMRITYKTPKCGMLSCEHYSKCHPTGSHDDMKYTVKNVGANVDCPEGEKMVFVDLD